MADDFVFSRPVEIDLSKLEVPDLKTLALAGTKFNQVEFVPPLVDLLEHVVVGGLAGRPSNEFWPLVDQVFTAVTRRADPND